MVYYVMLYLALLLAFIFDSALVYAARHSLSWLVPIVALGYSTTAVLWYTIYKSDKFLVLSAYYLVFSAFKDIFISQAIAHDTLSLREILGIALVFAGVATLQK
jgi:drug/metabolite transporter (DMT)-like permease